MIGEFYRKLFIALGIFTILSFLSYMYTFRNNENILMMMCTLLITTAIAVYSLFKRNDSTGCSLFFIDLALSWFNFLKALFIIAIILYGIDNTNDPKAKYLLNLILYISYICIYLYIYYSIFNFMGKIGDRCTTSGLISKSNSNKYNIIISIILILIIVIILSLTFVYLPEIVRSLPQGK